MKCLLNLIRIMVAISMPAAGFFLLMGTEGAFWVMQAPYGILVSQVAEQAEKEPAEARTARIEGARQIAEEISTKVMSFYAVVAWTGFFVTSSLCALSMWAGRKVKRLMQLAAAQEQRT